MMKRILHVTYDMRIGGTEQVIRNLIEGSVNTSISHYIFCIETPLGPWGKELAEKGLTIGMCHRQPGFDWRLIKHIRRFIVEHKIDVVHCHQYSPWVYGVIAATLTKAKVIFTEHGRFYPDYGTWKRKLVNPLLSACTNSVTAISAATKQALVKYENIKTNKVAVVYNGIKPLEAQSDATKELKKSLGLQQDTLVFGTIARFDPIKNHMMMLEAFSKVLLDSPNSVLVIVGDGEERGNIERKIQQLGISDKVILPGYQSNPSLFLNAMDVYLLSSFSEGTSMTLLEAMSLAKPCVVTDVGGNPEVIDNCVNGYVVKNDDAAAFAQAMSKLTESTVRSKMGALALDIFDAKFNVKIMVDSYMSLYNKI